MTLNQFVICHLIRKAAISRAVYTKLLQTSSTMSYPAYSMVTLSTTTADYTSPKIQENVTQQQMLRSGVGGGSGSDVSKLTGQKDVSPTCHPSLLRMDSSNLDPIK